MHELKIYLNNDLHTVSNYLIITRKLNKLNYFYEKIGNTMRFFKIMNDDYSIIMFISYSHNYIESFTIDKNNSRVKKNPNVYMKYGGDEEYNLNQIQDVIKMNKYE